LSRQFQAAHDARISDTSKPKTNINLEWIDLNVNI
jgi:hypothetical protein